MTRQSLAIALATAALAFATAPAFAAPDEIGTCLSDMSAEWQPCQFDPALPIQEDDPRWDCHTMGNRVCGPVAHGVAAADGGVPGPVAP